MILYFAILIPVVFVVVLWFKFKHSTTWWEFIIPFGASIVFILLSKLAVESINLYSNEYWGSEVIEARYYEDWDEWVHQICTRTYPCGKETCTETYDCSHRDYHPAEYYVITDSKEKIHISREKYLEILNKFGKQNEKFINLNRNYYSDDGDLYVVTFNGNHRLSIPVTTRHSYVNKIKASDATIFNFTDVKKEDVKQYRLYEYPSLNDHFKYPTVLGLNNPKIQERFQYINGYLGNKKQVRLWVLIHHNPDKMVGLMQESYWKGGNKNEFCIDISTDSLNGNIQWVHVFSWTPSEKLKVDIRDYIYNQKKINEFTLGNIAQYVQQNLEENFVRRSFKEFDYIEVVPPTWAIILVYILTIGLNLGISFWIINNEYTED